MARISAGSHLFRIDMFPIGGLSMDRLGSGIVECFHNVVVWLSDSMFVWPIMACCENYFVGISYPTISLNNRVVFPHV